MLAQAKAFIERKHETHLKTLVSTLDAEKWNQCDVTAMRQSGIDRLCSGRAVMAAVAENTSTTPNSDNTSGTIQQAKVDNQQYVRERSEHISVTSKMRERSEHAAQTAPLKTRFANGKSSGPEVHAIGVCVWRSFTLTHARFARRYRICWSALLLVQMLMEDLAAAVHFQSLSTDMVSKISELLRLFNSRTTQLVLGAGAIHSAAGLKSINAKHLALVSQCLAFVTTLLPHVRAALMAQLPRKQHALLNDVDKIKHDLMEHDEKILSKFVSIVGSIVENGLAPAISSVDYDREVGAAVKLSPFVDGVIKNVSKLHQVLASLLPPDQLLDIFSRIFNYLGIKVVELYLSCAEASNVAFRLPSSVGGKERMKGEVKEMCAVLGALEGTDKTKLEGLEERFEALLG